MYISLLEPRIIVLLAVAYTAHALEIVCPTGVHNVSALSHFTTRGAYGQYYPDYEDSTKCGTNQPDPNLAAIHYDRVDSGVDVPLPDGILGAIDAEGFHYSAPEMLDKLFIRWTFRIIFPCTGYYELYTYSDDGMKAFMNNELVADDYGCKHPAQTLAQVGQFWMEAGSVRAIEVNYYEHVGKIAAQLQWMPPGSDGTITIIPEEYMVPSMTAEVLVTTHNTITVSGEPEIEYFEARLSEKPTETVYVDIFNLAGGDIFGVDKCVLVFTPENWETPQRVHVAPILDSVSNRGVEGTMWITLEPRNNDQFAPGGVAVIDPSSSPKGGSEPGRVQCVGWGDPHYTMFDGNRFDLYAQGMYTLFRDYPGDMGVQTYLQPCDDIGARVSCTFIGYMTYMGTEVQFTMNQGTSYDEIWDPTVYVDVLADGGSAIGFRRDSPGVVVFDLPNGMSVKCTTGFYRKERKDGNHWRYLNFYVEAPSTMQDKLLGLCGYFDGDGSDENTNAAELAVDWLVPEDDWIIYGGMKPVASPTPSTVPVVEGEVTTSNYVPPPNSDVTIDNFSFEPACNPQVEPHSPLPTPIPGSAPVTPLIPPALNMSYVPIVNPPLDLEIKAKCELMINSVECPEMSTQDITGFVEGCTVDTMHAMLDDPPAEAAEPFLERCSFDQANQNVCSQCNAFQSCDSNQCVTVGSACGYGCGPPEQGSCDEANNVCVCTADYVGEHCELAVSPCTSHPCENGGTCIAEGLQPMCSCPDGFVGVSCQLYPLCTNRKEESSTGRIVQIEVYTECVE